MSGKTSFSFKPKNRSTRRDDYDPTPMESYDSSSTFENIGADYVSNHQLPEDQAQKDDRAMKKKLAKKRKKKDKYKNKELEVVAESKQKVTTDLRRHMSLKGSVESELDGVNTIHDRHVEVNLRRKEKRELEREKMKRRNEEMSQDVTEKKEAKDSKKNKKQKNNKPGKEHFMSSEKNMALSILDSLASKQEEWVSSRNEKEKDKISYFEEKNKKKEDMKIRQKELEAQVLAEVMRKATAEKKFKREMKSMKDIE